MDSKVTKFIGLWKDLMLYWLNLILSSNQGVALFRQKQILKSNRHKNLQKQNNEDSFFELLNAWLHFTYKNFPIPASTETFLDRPIFLNPQAKLDYCSDKPFSYRIPPRNIFRKSLQPDLISQWHLTRNYVFLLPSLKEYINLLWNLIGSHF